MGDRGYRADLSHPEIHNKFEDLEWLQRTRLAEGMLSNDPTHPFALEVEPEVKARNRYINVQAWANCRIHLRVPDGQCDFINALPITLRDSVTKVERKYIATQVRSSRAHFDNISLALGRQSTNSLHRVLSLDISRTFGTWFSMRARMSVSLSC